MDFVNKIIYVDGKKDWKKLSITAFITLFAGISSYFLINDFSDRFNNLKMPFFMVPGWLFIIVCAVFYLIAGICLYRLILKRPSIPVRNAKRYIAIAIFMSFLWPVIFFNFNMRGFAFLWAVLLAAISVKYMRYIRNVERIASRLFIPFTLWVVYSGLLNLFIWFLNK